MDWNTIRLVPLDNGIRLILQPMPHTRIVSIGIQIGAGSVTENPDQIGYSHFLEHMVFKGTQNRDYITINRDVEKFGGYLDAYTNRHYTLFYAKILGEYGLQALDVLSDIVFFPTFPAEELEKEKQVVMEEIAMYEDSPDENIIDLFFGHVYPNSYLGWPILGTGKIISALKRKDLISYWENLYRNDAIIVTVAGDFREKEIIDYLNGLPQRGNVPKTSNPRPEFFYGMGYREKEVEQVYLALGVESFSLFDDQRYALNLFSNILGGSSSSRLYLNIREKRGLCYSIGSSVSLDEKTGIFGIFTSTHEENASSILEAVAEEIRNFRKNPVTSEELDIAKAQIRSKMIFNQESISYCMQKNASYLFWYGKILSTREILEKIEKTSLKEINEVYESLFSQGQLSGYAILPKGYGKKMPKKLNIT